MFGKCVKEGSREGNRKRKEMKEIQSSKGTKEVFARQSKLG